MASEPAEPTTRQEQEPEVRISPPAFYPQVEIAVRFPDQRHWEIVRRCNTLLYVAPGSGLDKMISEHWGLLADPAQTTELEELRRFGDRDRQAALRRQAENERLRRERDLLLWLHAEAAWRVAGFDVLTVTLARRNHRLTAERDERQARIDAALAHLANYDTSGGWQATHEVVEQARVALKGELSARAALVGDQPPAEATLECPHCRSLIRAASGAITQLDVDTHLAACQPARQFARECATAALSGEALRDVEERDDAAGDLP